ncbi:glyoxalase [Silvimonas amylolytica]|uniref:glyoxalase n=1 Tax=Silvimonas amylolytica TaxID=449663 RepID=UPI00166869C1|nr:glyoxalase [Silvimonas amylolytica]
MGPDHASLCFFAVLLAAGLIAAPVQGADVGVGPQYDTTHVYVDVADVDAFAKSFLATFGGQSTRQVVATVTPTASSTTSQLLQTPVGTVSLFGFKTPVPWPFGTERNGYLVTDMDAAVTQARAAGAHVLVAPFPDPIGRDAVIQWPGGVNLQLYWHTSKPDYAAFQSVPENRVYISPDAVDAYVAAFLKFSHGKLVADDPRAPGIEVGQPQGTYRRVRIESLFGRTALLATDGHLPWPYGRDNTGYEVADLTATLARAQAAGVKVLVAPFASQNRVAAMVEFPGGYIAEIHSVAATLQ